jgi:hypothetical protein
MLKGLSLKIIFVEEREFDHERWEGHSFGDEGGGQRVLKDFRGPAFFRFYDLLPARARLLPPSPSCQQIVSLSQSSCVSSVQLTDGRGGGGRG